MDTSRGIAIVREAPELLGIHGEYCYFVDFFGMGTTKKVDDMTPVDWALFIHQINEVKGWNLDRNESEWAALAHSEISEAYEEYRNGNKPNQIYFNTDSDKPDKPEGMPIEYADLLIRVFHWFAYHGVNPNEVLAEKIKYNLTRPYRHGGKVT